MHVGHGCSSQVCCVNFLYSLAQDETRPTRWVEHLTAEIEIKSNPIERRHGREQIIIFEWLPDTDYLNESVGGRRAR